MIKVAVIGGPILAGGKKNLIMEYFRHIDRTQVCMHIISNDDSDAVPVEEIEALGGKALFVPSFKNLRGHTKCLYEIFKREKYDVVHAYNSTMNLFPMYAAKKAGIKVRISESLSMAAKGEFKTYIKYMLKPFASMYANYFMSCGEDCGIFQFGQKAFDEGKIAMAFMKLMRTDFLRKNNIRHIDELKQGAEGYVFNIQLFENIERAYYLNKPLLHYIYNGQSISHTSSVKNNLLIVRCLEWIDEYVKKSKNPIDLHPGVLNRMLYVICTTAITGYFNPYNKQSHREKVAGFRDFMKEPLVEEAMCHAPRMGLNIQRKIILSLINLRMYKTISLLGWLRRKQLENK